MGENSSQVLCDLIEEKLKIKISKSDISTAHRIGQKPANQQPDKRKIIAKLCRRDLKSDLLNACRQLKPNIYINESLTPARSTILFILRKAKKMFPNKISGCNSRDGRIQVWVRPPNIDGNGTRNIRVFVNTRSALEEFCYKSLGVSLETFVEEWQH